MGSRSDIGGRTKREKQVVECEGADRWIAAEDDRLTGGLWQELSGGRCRFVMVKDKRWDWIDGVL